MTSAPARTAALCTSRVNGKFLEVDARRFLIKGIAYGTFAPDANGEQFPAPLQIAKDVALMASAGFNTIRTYTAPPPTLLDAAIKHGLRVMIGLDWPQHIPFLDDSELTRRIRLNLVSKVRRLAPHPATLMVAVGNEIPPGIVRWHGQHRIEHFLRELYEDLKAAAPESLLTYVNYPPTEYLELSYFDVCAFNVYLHREPDLRAYLARLQHIAGTKPFLLAEAGSDSLREGLDGQARITAMHLRAAFAEGACGAIAYSWTDEWWRGGHFVDDWAFGLVDASRRPKSVFAAAKRVFKEAPFTIAERAKWPKVSVVVCAYNAASTIDDCLDSLSNLTYPRVETIVVNDGSCDATVSLARQHTDVRVIDVPNGGLSAARNSGLAAAAGKIVAYTDADCRVDADWLTYLVQPILVSDVVGAGGPNITPPDDSWVSQCVARAPGEPTHVMLNDRIAEHVPGCNMAFRRDALLAINGFNPVYVCAGDDVDICWRFQANKLRIGFAPSAVVWHHRRPSVLAYWRQQVGYGEGEAWLEAHHPEKFLSGQMMWRGRIYSQFPFLSTVSERRVNTGVWGTAAFPSVYSTQAHQWHLLPHSPLWMAMSLALLFVGVFGPLARMDAAWLPLVAGLFGWTLTIVRCLMCGWRSELYGLPSIGQWSPRKSRILYRGLIAGLHLLQPLARLKGRLSGLSRPKAVTPQHVSRYPWKSPMPTLTDFMCAARLVSRGNVEHSFWSESWTPHATLLNELVGVLRASRPAPVVDVDDGWCSDRDLSLAIGRWGWLHVRTLVEEHERGSGLFRVRVRLSPSFVGTLRGLTLAVVVAGGMSASIFLYRPSVTLFVSVIVIAVIGARAAWQATRAATVLHQALTQVTTAAGLLRLPTSPAVAPRLSSSTETTVSNLRG